MSRGHESFLPSFPPSQTHRTVLGNVQEEKVLNLDDLFRKTNALPVLYWLPLNDEQVAAKEAALANKAKAASKETAVK